MRRPELIARQSACPSGLLGRIVAHIMARETAAANDAALELLDLEPGDRVLEIGFGHGATIQRMAAEVYAGKVCGVDPSDEMCRMAIRRNQHLVDEGRVDLRQATAEALPYADAVFDKVLSVHTLYFWPELSRPLREISRVLRNGGRLVLAHRTDPEAARDFRPPIYRFPSDDEVALSLESASLAVLGLTHRTFGRARLSYRVAGRCVGIDAVPQSRPPMKSRRTYQNMSATEEKSCREAAT